MEAIEFDAVVKDGAIDIPLQYQAQVVGNVHVVVRPSHVPPSSSLIRDLLARPLDIPGLRPMSRDEIYGE